MKKLLFSMVSLFVAFSAFAQTETTGIIKGAVIDKNGNPLPGAMVQSTGGAETVLVESDGTFVLEVPIWLKTVSASYPGMGVKKQKVDFNNQMLFKLSPRTKFGFINLMGGWAICADDTQANAPIIGLMGGYLDTWGVYGKIGIPAGGEDLFSGIQAIVGGIKHIYNGLYGYVGLGYGGYLDWDYWDVEGYWTPGMAFDGGFLMKIGKHFDITLGLTVNTDFDYGTSVTPTLSLGYVW